MNKVFDIFEDNSCILYYPFDGDIRDFGNKYHLYTSDSSPISDVVKFSFDKKLSSPAHKTKRFLADRRHITFLNNVNNKNLYTLTEDLPINQNSTFSINVWVSVWQLRSNQNHWLWAIGNNFETGSESYIFGGLEEGPTFGYNDTSLFYSGKYWNAQGYFHPSLNWYMLTWVYEPKNLSGAHWKDNFSLYINGEKYDCKQRNHNETLSLNFGPDNFSNVKLRIGSMAQVSSINELTSNYADFRIFNKKLTREDLKILHRQYDYEHYLIYDPSKTTLPESTIPISSWCHDAKVIVKNKKEEEILHHGFGF